MKTSALNPLFFLALALLTTACSNKVPDCDSDVAVDRLIEKLHSDEVSINELQRAIGGTQLASYVKDLPQRIRHDDFSVRSIELLSVDKNTERTSCRAKLSLSPNPKLAQKFLDFSNDLKSGSKSKNGIGKISEVCAGIHTAALISFGFKSGGIESLTRTTTVTYEMSKNLSEGDLLLTYDADTRPLGLPIYVAMTSRCYDERFGEYEGDLIDGVRHGEGKVVFPSGFAFEGQFKHGKPDGRGKATWTDGTTYVGEIRQNMREGRGTMTYANGQKYVGEFKNNKEHGEGIFYGQNGDLLKQGIWSNGRYKTGSDGETVALTPEPSQKQNQKSDVPSGHRSLQENASRRSAESSARGSSQKSERSELQRGTRTLE